MTGGDTATPTVVADRSDLIAKLRGLASETSGAAVISIPAGSYDLNDEVFEIRSQKLTLQAQPNERVVLKNVTLFVNVAYADQILIQDLAFRSGGGASDTPDAIRLSAAGTPPSATPRKKARVRITTCSFDGYRDIAIDSRSSTAYPQLLATIDGNFFFDANPGKPNTLIDGFPAFVNRGAINIGSLEGASGSGTPQLASDSLVTIALNVFVDVWRRCPRIAGGNFGHIYNNLLYRWGFGNDEDKKSNKTSSWRGIEIGGGDGVENGGNNGTALIEANRFIPWAEKKKIDTTITLNANTSVEVGTSSSLSNRFDDPNGVRRADVDYAEHTSQSLVPVGTGRYTDLGIFPPQVRDVTTANWLTLARAVGPRAPQDASTRDARARQKIVDLVTAAP